MTMAVCGMPAPTTPASAEINATAIVTSAISILSRSSRHRASRDHNRYNDAAESGGGDDLGGLAQDLGQGAFDLGGQFGVGRCHGGPAQVSGGAGRGDGAGQADEPAVPAFDFIEAADQVGAAASAAAVQVGRPVALHLAGGGDQDLAGVKNAPCPG